MIDPKELADALAAIPPVALCAVIDGARRKAQEEREAAEAAKREAERVARNAASADLRMAAAKIRAEQEAKRRRREMHLE